MLRRDFLKIIGLGFLVAPVAAEAVYKVDIKPPADAKVYVLKDVHLEIGGQKITGFGDGEIGFDLDATFDGINPTALGLRW